MSKWSGKTDFFPLLKLKMWELTIQNQDKWKCLWITQSNKTSIEKIINNFLLYNSSKYICHQYLPEFSFMDYSFCLPSFTTCLWIFQRSFFFLLKMVSCFCLVQLVSWFLVIKSATVLGILSNTHQTNQTNEQSKRRNKASEQIQEMGGRYLSSQLQKRVNGEL